MGFQKHSKHLKEKGHKQWNYKSDDGLGILLPRGILGENACERISVTLLNIILLSFREIKLTNQNIFETRPRY